MAWDDLRGNILQAGLSKIYAKVAGDSSTAYYDLGDFYEGKLSATSFTRKNKKAIPNGFGVDFNAGAKLMYTKKTVMMAVLNILHKRNLDLIVRTDNGVDFSSEHLDNPFFGFRWKFVCEGDMDKDRYIDIGIDRRMTAADWTAVRASIPALGTADAQDELYGIRAMTAAEVIAAGLAKIEFRLASAGSWTDTIMNFRKAKVEVEGVVTKNQFGMSVGTRNIKVSVEVEALQSSGTELDLLAASGNTFINALYDYKVTFAGDGMIMTLDNMAGMIWTYANESDADDSSVVKMRIEGTITDTQLDSLFT